jgi:hypothetical protein
MWGLALLPGIYRNRRFFSLAMPIMPRRGKENLSWLAKALDMVGSVFVLLSRLDYLTILNSI